MTSDPLVPPTAVETATNFRAAMRRLASAVGVVTANGSDGQTGMAATSITSLTVEPPAMLVCVNRTASLHACLTEGARLCVNLLSNDQQDISAAFGGAVARELRFTVGSWSPDAHGVARLEGAQANLSCTVDLITAYGTHSIVVVRVDEVRIGGDVAPLIYQDGRYL